MLSTLGGVKVQDIGELVFSETSWHLVPKDSDHHIDNETRYCIGLESIIGMSCLKYSTFSAAEDIVIYLNENDDIQQLTTARSMRNSQVKLRVERPLLGPVPARNLKTVQKTEEGRTEIKDEAPPIPEKSFVQKYWMYMVPVAIIFLLLPDGGASSARR